jgi:hypothetical protein
MIGDRANFSDFAGENAKIVRERLAERDKTAGASAYDSSQWKPFSCRGRL